MTQRPTRPRTSSAVLALAVTSVVAAAAPALGAGHAPGALVHGALPTPSPSSSAPWDGDTTPPTAPGAPEVVRLDGTTVDLRWAASQDEWEVTYTLYDELSGAYLGRTYAPGTRLEGLEPHTEYAVYVTAQDMAGNAAPRSPATRFTTGEAPAPACTVRYRTERRPGGFVGRVTVTNGTSQTIEGWRLWWAFVNGERATRVWNASVISLEEGVVVENLPRNARIEPGESVTVRFRATGVPVQPAQVVLDGRVCALG